MKVFASTIVIFRDYFIFSFVFSFKYLLQSFMMSLMVKVFLFDIKKLINFGHCQGKMLIVIHSKNIYQTFTMKFDQFLLHAFRITSNIYTFTGFKG